MEDYGIKRFGRAFIVASQKSFCKTAHGSALVSDVSI